MKHTTISTASFTLLKKSQGLCAHFVKTSLRAHSKNLTSKSVSESHRASYKVLKMCLQTWLQRRPRRPPGDYQLSAPGAIQRSLRDGVKSSTPDANPRCYPRKGRSSAATLGTPHGIMKPSNRIREQPGATNRGGRKSEPWWLSPALAAAGGARGGPRAESPPRLRSPPRGQPRIGTLGRDVAPNPRGMLTSGPALREGLTWRTSPGKLTSRPVPSRAADAEGAQSAG